MAKAMVAESRETVSLANARVRETVDDLTDRVSELSAIIGKVTRLATRIASVTATAVGGIKAGAKIFGIGRKKPKAGAVARERDEMPRLRRRR